MENFYFIDNESYQADNNPSLQITSIGEDIANDCKGVFQIIIGVLCGFIACSAVVFGAKLLK